MKEQLVQMTLNLKSMVGEVHEYQIPVVVDGVYYCHNFPTGVMGKPISGDNIGRALLIKNKVSSTVGHIHTFDSVSYTHLTLPTTD